MTCLLQQKESQSSRELRRKDLECCKLKEKLLRLLSDKGGGEGAPTMEVSGGNGNPVPCRGRRGRRAGWATDSTTQVRGQYVA